MNNASSAIAALSQRNERSPTRNCIFIALTTYQMAEDLSSIAPIETNSGDQGKEGEDVNQIPPRSPSSLQEHTLPSLTPVVAGAVWS